MSDIKFPQGLYELMDAYDGFIIDQWGVLHNGVEAHSEAIDVLNHLKKAQKEVVILSNSSKRSEDNIDRLKKIGVKPAHYVGIVTSGEVAWNALKDKSEMPFKLLGNKCYLISRHKDYSLLDGLEIETVRDIEDADFILITGFDAALGDVSCFDGEFKKAVVKHIPAICANPDIVAMHGHEKIIMAGAIASRYQEMGGTVHYTGKPNRSLFRYCLKKFSNAIPSRVLVIGDSIKHDIGGAMNAEFDSLFITSGIHHSEFKHCSSDEERRKVMLHVSSLYGGIAPNYVMPSLIWQTKEAAIEERNRMRNLN